MTDDFEPDAALAPLLGMTPKPREGLLPVEQVEIEPCPFCGSAGKMIHPMGHWQGTEGFTRPAYGPDGSRITCSNDQCSCCGWPFYGPDQDAQAIEWWNTRASTTAQNRADVVEAEVQRLMHVIDRDRYVVAACLGQINAAIDGRVWLLEGRGPYEWDDDRYREEFGDALKSIREAAQPLSIVAWDKSDCTRIEERVKAARHAARELLAKPIGPRAMIAADVFGDPRDAEIERLTAALASLSPAPAVNREKPYLSDQFEWAAPGDQQEDAWLVRFCDNDIRDALYTGPDAEREARAAWERHAPGYNMYLFRLARLATPPSDGFAAGEWRPASSPPPRDKKVLILYWWQAGDGAGGSETHDIGYWSGSFWYNDYASVIDAPSDWMPLPTPPARRPTPGEGADHG